MNLQVDFLLNKAMESLASFNLDTGELYLKQALKMQPNNPHTLRLFGVLLAQRENYEDALYYLSLSINFLPKNGVTHSNLGNVLIKMNRLEESVKSYDAALKLLPKDPEVWSNKGNALFELRRYEEAIAHHDKSISISPDYAAAWSNKGNVLFELRRYEEAIAHYERAINLMPDYAEFWANIGSALFELRRYEEAITYYQRAINVKPDINWFYGKLIHTKLIIADWQNYDEFLLNLRDKVKAGQRVSEPFDTLSTLDSVELHQKSAQIYIQSRYAYSNKLVTPISRKLYTNKIRVGYYSSDFNDHPVAYLLVELFELHNKQEFELFAFALDSDGATSRRGRIKDSVTHFIEAGSMSNQEIASLSAELEIDIAVDLGGHTKNSQAGIFIRYRAAPIQINFLGYPGTLGSDCYDYIVADKVVIPENNQQFFDEKIIYLPNSYLVDDSKRLLDDVKFTRSMFGLPEEKFIFCCFNNSYKFNPDFVKSLARIMKEVGESVFWLSENNELFRANFSKELQSQGINEDRIIFAKRVDSMGEHLARIALADLFLDTSPYNAHTTALDALKAGLPVLTLIGESFPSRVAASLLNTLKLPELITCSRMEFENQAIKLANDRVALQEIKMKLVKNSLSGPLFDTPRYTKNLESAYRQICMNYDSGLPADHIYVSE
jgi:protein O-GlcNAc transferase